MNSAASSTLSILIVLSVVFLSVPTVVPVDAQSFSCGDVTEIPQVECEALVALYNSTGGDGWADNTNWLVTNTPSNWYGVTVTAGHASSIWLPDNLLAGTIPPELGNLAALQVVELYLNQLTDSIPPELGNLAALTDLLLDRNQLSGSIPPELGNLAALTHLNLSVNNLTGSIPPELGNLAALTVLDLDWNSLRGSIPPELGNLTALQELWLFSNMLSGSIPSELANLPALERLLLEGNYLSGSIPPELGNLTALTYLSLATNFLTGSIPPELGNLSALQVLKLSYNQLTGSIPLSFVDLSQLDRFWFFETDLCEPTSPEYLAWTATVADYQGTGVCCLYNVPWLIMYYIAADNDLDREGDAEKIPSFLLSHEGGPDYDVAVLFDGSENDDSRSYYIADDVIPGVEGEVNSGDPDTLVEFADWALGLSSAEHAALSIFGHGSLAGVARDDTSGSDYIELTELGSALGEIVSAHGKMDIVFMEACVMGTIETAFQIRDYTDFYIASENMWWGPTYPWYLDTITSSTQPEELAKDMARNYHKDMVDRGVPHTVSVAQLSAMSRLAQEVSTFSELVRFKVSDYAENLIRLQVLAEVQRFDSPLSDCEIDLDDELLDLYDWARLIRDKTTDSDLRDAAQNVMDAVQDADPADRYIIYNEPMSGTVPVDLPHCGGETWDLNNSHGVSIFWPKPFSKRSFYTGSNLAFAEGTDWGVSTESQPVGLLSETIQWGPMLVDYVEEVTPEALDDPTLPPLQEPLSTWRHCYLPLVLR